jgi:hypothetical protein
MRKLLHNIGTSIRIFYLRYPIIFGIVSVTTMLVAGVLPVVSVPGWIAFLCIVSMLVQDFVRDVFGPCRGRLEFWR